MLPAVRVADFVVDRIAAAIGGVPPEQGGALLGVPGLDYVTGFVHDAGAATTGVVYHNSEWLIREIASVEERTAARFKGVIHSHPERMPVPSAQDRREYAESLRLNAHLGRYVAPIVTHDVRTPPRAHELVLGPARISFFGAVREAGGGAAVDPVRPVVVPVVRMLRRAGIAPEADPATVDVEGSVLLATHARIAGFGGVTLLLGADFPATAPVVLAADGEALGLVWDLAVPAMDRMGKAVLGLRQDAARRAAARTGSRGREARADPHQPGSQQSGLPESGARPSSLSESEPSESGTWQPEALADEAGTGQTGVPAPGTALRDRAFAPLFARTEGLLSPRLADRRVLLVGAGSVGSYLAEVLARSGVGAFTLVDPDAVEPANLGRTAYRLADVGLAKVHALADLVLSVNPAARVELHEAALDELDGPRLADLVAEADLVIAATDDNEAQARAGHFAYRAGRPAVFPGLYRGAAGGEVIVAVEGTPCWSCCTGGVRDTLAADGDDPYRPTDYGTGRLIAEPGLLADIHHVSSAAAKLALGLLHAEDDDSGAARFAREVVASRQTYAAFGHEPGFWIFDGALRGAPAQYAYQSLWLTPTGRPDCAVCGDPEGRTDPAAYRSPDTDVIRGLLR